MCHHTEGSTIQLVRWGPTNNVPAVEAAQYESRALGLLQGDALGRCRTDKRATRPDGMGNPLEHNSLFACAFALVSVSGSRTPGTCSSFVVHVRFVYSMCLMCGPWSVTRVFGCMTTVPFIFRQTRVV